MTVTLEDIRAAATRIKSEARRTRFVESEALNARLGGRVLVKPEVLQRTGSFKFRGAYNCIAQIPEAERKRGVVAFSSGNHAQGVAASAAIFGIPAVIIMPRDAPAIKIANVRAMGAEVLPYDRFGEDRNAIAQLYVDKGMRLVPPYDDPAIIAGQGTIGLEVAEDAAAMGVTLDALITPAGGGGLASGIATAIKALSPATEIWGAEPEQFDDVTRSLAAGEVLRNAPGGQSICDAILTPEPGTLTWPILKAALSGGVAVSDDDAREAMRIAAENLKLVVEPGGAVALAALTSGRFKLEGRTVVVVLSGGNVDRAAYAAILAG
ncbi:threonine/serine dehydratase [Salmonella enterica subsp. enterica]|nr:threonine/serine dehydratase [Salmonella enterica subsp. enterica serovar Enteritidis]